MKMKIEKEVLLKAVQSLQNVISPKATLPILTNILIEAQKDKLRMVATDLKTRMTAQENLTDTLANYHKT